jgi:curved DNA-binding protein CbpA
MPDLYAALNVPRDADRATIRSAYRQRAKAAHPDTPEGSREKFALVKLAHDTLTDDTRRARYDQTGDAEESPIDNRRAQLLEMLSAGLDMAMAKLYERASPPIHSDMVLLTKESLREMRRKVSEDRRELQKNIDISKELLGRWSATKGENVMEVITAHRVKYCESNIAVLDGRIALIDLALTTLDSSSFRFDATATRVRRDGLDFVTFGELKWRDGRW